MVDEVFFSLGIHPGRLTAGTCPHGGLVQIIFLSKWVIYMFHVNFSGCIKSTFLIPQFDKHG